MYNCPFKDHDDKKPSFRFHRKGYIAMVVKRREITGSLLKIIMV